MDTTRQKIISLLSEGEYGAKAISKILRISEKEVFEHLEHIGRSVKSHNMKLEIIPALCLECGYVFESSTTILRSFLNMLYLQIIMIHCGERVSQNKRYEGGPGNVVCYLGPKVRRGRVDALFPLAGAIMCFPLVHGTGNKKPFPVPPA
ncbi:hypothetical protein SBDP1_520071 [Syntrophobacter sp. SbD1]|nr:hypothetical protein SBDP1_520071 [Syntrophobacter sp. SbD1]